MFSSKPHRESPGSGFSILELLAAIAVLSLMLVLLSQLSSSTMRATSVTMKQIDATRQARAVLDTLSEDVAAIVTSNGLGSIFLKTEGSDTRLTFVTLRRGPQGADARYVAVDYTLQNGVLTRTVSPIAWEEVDFATAAFQTGSYTDTSVLAEGILRFEAVLNLDNGDTRSLADAGTWRVQEWNGTALPSGFYAIQVSRGNPDPASPKVVSLTAAVAALDTGSYQLPKANEIGTKLSPAAADQTPQEAWTAAINSGSLNVYPEIAVAALRVLQRTYPLP